MNLRRLFAATAISLVIAHPVVAMDLTLTGLHMHGVGGGGGSCPFGTTYPDGCYTGGTFSQPLFYSGYSNGSYTGGYANQSFQYSGLSLPGITILQPATYVTRTPWNQAGVDYAVGIQASYLSHLKDPATDLATDPLVNPPGHANCAFVDSGANAWPYRAPNGGKEILCDNNVNPTAIKFQGYDSGRYGFNSGGATVNDCVPIVIKGDNWPSITIDNNIFVDGPNCNSLTATIGGTTYNAVSAGGVTFQIYYVAGFNVPKTFTNNTVFGCGGPDVLRPAEFQYTNANPLINEATRCALNFVQGTGPVNGTITLSGTTLTVLTIPQGTLLDGAPITCAGCTGDIHVTSIASGGGPGTYTVTNPNGSAVTNVAFTSYAVTRTGFAPYDNHFGFMADDGNITMEYNAWLHLPGRGFNLNASGGGFTFERHFDYLEGMGYIHGPGVGEHFEFIEWGAATSGTTTVHDSFNTCLQTSQVDTEVAGGETESCNYLSAGGQPTTGTQDLKFANGSYFTNDVMITNINPNLASYATTSIACVAYQDNTYGNITLGPNYCDPTGAVSAYNMAGSPTSAGSTVFTGNVNLLQLANNINRWDTVVGTSGTYNNSTGLMSINLGFPSVNIGVGTNITVTNIFDGGGTNRPGANVTGNTQSGSGPTLANIITTSGLGFTGISRATVKNNADVTYGAQ